MAGAAPPPGDADASPDDSVGQAVGLAEIAGTEIAGQRREEEVAQAAAGARPVAGDDGDDLGAAVLQRHAQALAPSTVPVCPQPYWSTITAG